MRPGPHKKCPSCKRLLLLLKNVTFNAKRGAPDGFQPWCRECDHSNKNTIEYGWTEFSRLLRSSRSERPEEWTETMYRDLIGKGECHYSGSALRVWGGGHWIDRISNARPHTPANCVPCCWPCNRRKSSRNPEAATREIEALVLRYTRGKIPWDEVDGRKPYASRRPSLADYVVLPSECQLALDIGAP